MEYLPLAHADTSLEGKQALLLDMIIWGKLSVIMNHAIKIFVYVLHNIKGNLLDIKSCGFYIGHYFSAVLVLDRKFSDFILIITFLALLLLLFGHILVTFQCF